LGIGVRPVQLAGAPPASFPVPKGYGGQPPEARLDPSGGVQVNPDIVMRHSVCMGCYSSCGNRVKIDKKSGRILRVMGNPYSPKCAEPALGYEAPLAAAYQAFGMAGNLGHTHRATVCGRGNATFQAVYDPLRILTPLKRVGQRGEGKWKPITWSQLLDETVEGGQLFKETGDPTYIEGFRQVRNVKDPVDPNSPELGPKSNGLVWNDGGSYGRVNFPQRFVLNSFGSTNFYGHAGT
jgi:tetrathionate reductase subunit A